MLEFGILWESGFSAFQIKLKQSNRDRNNGLSSQRPNTKRE